MIILVVLAAALLARASYLLIIALVYARSISQPSYPYLKAGILLIASGILMAVSVWPLGRLKGIQARHLTRWTLLLIGVGLVFVVMDVFLISHVAPVYLMR